MWIFFFSVTQNQTQISSKTRRILKIAIPKLSKELLKYVSEKQPYSVQLIRYVAVNDVGFCLHPSPELPFVLSIFIPYPCYSHTLVKQHHMNAVPLVRKHLHAQILCVLNLLFHNHTRLHQQSLCR